MVTGVPRVIQLEHFITNTPAIYKQHHDNFVLLKVNVSDENYNEPSMKGFPKTFGYPHIFITENDGSIIYSGDTVQLLEKW